MNIKSHNELLEKTQKTNVNLQSQSHGKTNQAKQEFETTNKAWKEKKKKIY